MANPSVSDTEALPAANKTSKGAARRAQILEAALDILATDGHAGLTLEGVASTVGIRKGNLQYYFPSRAALLRAALSEQIDQHRKTWEKTYEPVSGDPLAHLKKIIAYELEVNLDETFIAQVRERWSLEARDDSARILTNQWYEWVTDQYADLIAKIRTDLGENTCHQLAIVIYSMLVGSAPFFGNNRAAPRWSKDIGKRIEESIIQLVLDTRETPNSTDGK